ncbi:MAG: SDR family NAD(P)-dependent oxidoreductase [bacterium]
MHVLITGASSGIGDAIAREFAGHGHSVSLVARREKELQALAASFSGPSFVRPADLSQPEVCEAVLTDCEEALGPIDVLVNNAGIQYVEPTDGITIDRMRRLFEVDLLTPLALIQGVLPSMIGRGAGHIVNVSSVAGITHTPGMCHYNGAKAGLAACSESLRVEVAPQGVHVLTVYPGPVRSPMEEAARGAFEESWATKYIPTGDAATLAKLIHKAVLRREERIVYPASYGLTRFTRVSSQWFTDRLTPPVLKNK